MGVHRLYLLLILINVLFSCGETDQLFVSPTGDDGNPGSEARPLATLEKAWVLANDPSRDHSQPVYINLLPGTYYLHQPIRLEEPEEKKSDNQIIYQATQTDSVIISGGITIRDWIHDPDQGWWTTKIPDAGEYPDHFRELFVDDVRAVRARHPNVSFLHIARSGEDRRTNFFFYPGDFPVPQKVQDVELAVLHDWSMTRIGIKQIDFDLHQITAMDSIGARSLPFFNLDHWEEHPRYFLENDLAFLDEDSEWYFNPETRILYLKMAAGQNPNMHRIVIPVLDRLMILSGNKDHRISNLSFQGIHFKHCAWHLEGGRYGGIQACHHDLVEHSGGWSVVESAVYAAWCENISFRNCRFSQLGGSGLHLATASKNCLVENCHFEDISGNGIMVGEGQHRKVEGSLWWKAVPDEAATANTLSRCTITKTGAQFYGAVGVWCGLTRETNISDSHIYDLPYSGISVGWMWNPEVTPCRNNRIEENHIHDIMQILSDGGGIYMLGRQPGSQINGNHIHDVKINAGRAESNGMFIDEGSTEIMIENNLIYRIARSPLRFHRAGRNLVARNILITPDSLPPVRFNNTPSENIEMIENEIMVTEKLTGTNLDSLIRQWQLKKKDTTPH